MNDLFGLIFDLLCMPFPAGGDDDDDDEYDEEEDDDEYCVSYRSSTVPHSSRYRN